jgi:hypothetical protein
MKARGGGGSGVKARDDGGVESWG